MDIKDIKHIEKATKFSQADAAKLGVALLFILGTAVLASFSSSSLSGNIVILIFATMVGGYMAINIGANDVANNVGPAVGSRALTMGGAILIAAICEASGAIIAGGDVVDTIRSGIISKEILKDRETFILLMLSALISSAIWLHLATAIGAPVSTTHSIVGGILGAGIVAGGAGIVNWLEIASIASSWIISPLFGGVVAALFLILIKRTITYKSNKIIAAKRVIPWLLFTMSGAFSLYLITKGLKRLIALSLPLSLLISLAVATIVFFVSRHFIFKAAGNMQNTKEEINRFFTIPLIFAAALLSFAHGANDVANAIGPLAAINEALMGIANNDKAGVPLWIMLVGGMGISLGLALYGPKLIKTVGSEITDLDQIRAFCVAMSAAFVVLIASQLGLPVSSTHIAVGAVFGVGFLREHLKKRYFEMEQQIIEAHQNKESGAKVQEFLARFRRASITKKGLMLKNLKQKTNMAQVDASPKFNKKEKRQLRKVYKEELVKRSALNRIVATWVITVPAAALLSAGVFALLQNLPIQF